MRGTRSPGISGLDCKDFLEAGKKRLYSLTMTKRRLIDMNKAADYLGVKKPTLYSWVLQRKIPFIKVGRLVKF